MVVSFSLSNGTFHQVALDLLMWFDIWMTTSYIFVLGFLKASVVFAKPCPDTQKESVKIVLQMPKTSLCRADGHLDLKSIVYFWKCTYLHSHSISVDDVRSFFFCVTNSEYRGEKNMPQNWKQKNKMAITFLCNQVCVLLTDTYLENFHRIKTFKLYTCVSWLSIYNFFHEILNS